MNQKLLWLSLVCSQLSACSTHLENRTAKLYSGTGGGWYFTTLTSDCVEPMMLRCFKGRNTGNCAPQNQCVDIVRAFVRVHAF